MAIFNGKKLNIEIYGESHAQEIGVKIKGLPKFNYDLSKLHEFLDRRKPSKSVFSTARKEEDKPLIGIDNHLGILTAEIKNTNKKSGDYDNLYGKPRPSHADYSSFLKDGTLDYSGGGRFSGRLTAPLCIVGGVLKQYLKSLGIEVHAYVSSVGEINAKSYLNQEISQEEILNNRDIGGFPSLDKKDEILNLITSVKKDGDSVGGVIECIVYGMKRGVGDNLFEGLEGKIASLVYSVPAVKGVEFGGGFNLSKKVGSTANDSLYYDGDSVKFKTNNSGGINGGISNGEPITLRVAVKPTPSISKEQETVDLVNKKNCKIKISGRHDACIVPRAVPCIESAVIIALVDELIGE